MIKQMVKKALGLNRDQNSMNGINNYGMELSQRDIKRGFHREHVGGKWEEIGKLQFDFVVSNGLQSEHKFLDIGCGALRSGVKFIEYLDKSNYYGIDVNKSLIEAGRMELKSKGLMYKNPNLLVNDMFEVYKFSEKFDFILSVSVFTHLYMNHIILCLSEAKKCMHEKSIYFATFYEASESIHAESIKHMPSEKVTNYIKNPFHYSMGEIKMMADLVGLNTRYIGNWNHPRDQIMVAFTKS